MRWPWTFRLEDLRERVSTLERETHIARFNRHGSYEEPVSVVVRDVERQLRLLLNYLNLEERPGTFISPTLGPKEEKA